MFTVNCLLPRSLHQHKQCLSLIKPDVILWLRDAKANSVLEKSVTPALIVFVGSKQLTLIMNILIRCILPISTDKMSEKQNLIIHDDAVEVEKDMRRMQDGRVWWRSSAES